MPHTHKSIGYLDGQMLIAMPRMEDARFARTVVYLCAHTAEGAMGLVVNRLFNALSFPDLLKQLDIEPTPICDPIRIHFGGPVEAGRGFVLHSSDYVQDTTLLVDDHVGLTATIDVLKAIAQGNGPRQSMLALGYAGWNAGQLDYELRENVWLNVPADDDLLFGAEIEHKWERAIAKIGVDFSMLSGDSGHA
ncbi:YqgE/AlgH family protein [Telmatospirillum sp.]|uniref:YqgE/AlgH family protein n=1 Tax=Telmatospirillum sp. TaxID=2079197 RepID=UPI0028416EDB|nr:YqgE/AlgH family protein [Telmatospirillum sp.]MDR3435941.1 YqgE/AlgH family protein [Telmatospirillum sp.]